ncbi:MAG: SUMF1/EgtB/PvdO family nonheme iron enzyme [Phycisphaerae bacterium]
MGRISENITGLLLAASVVVSVASLGCSKTHGPHLDGRRGRTRNSDWHRSMRMARAMLLFNRPRTATNYARAAILLAPDEVRRQEAISLRRRTQAGVCEDGVNQESSLSPSPRRDRRCAVVARPFGRSDPEIDHSIAQALASSLLLRLRRDRYQPLSREALPAILDERDLAAAAKGFDTDRTNLTPADLLVTGSIYRVTEGWRVTASLVDIGTSRILQTATVDTNSLGDPDALAGELVQPMQLPPGNPSEISGSRWIGSLLQQAADVEDKGFHAVALERYLDCIAIAPEDPSVRRAFDRFQDRQARRLRFQLPPVDEHASTDLPRIRLMVGDRVFMELLQLPDISECPSDSRIWMQTTEVTQRQYRSVTGHQPSRHVGPDLPVERVSWYDANAFCQALSRKTGLNVRLPSEAMWKRASHAGKRQRRTHRAERPGPRRDPPASNGPVPVRSRAPNGWGLYGFGDNVAEWCRSSSEEATPVDGPPRVPVRGGSWACPIYQRNPGARRLAGPSGRTSDVGFRVILREPYSQQPERESSDEGS